MDWAGAVLRAGNNGWVCFRDPPGAEASPLCFDGPWQSWARAWQGREPIAIPQAATAYMLMGDAGASKVDPYAAAATAEGPVNR